jgi:hypothetical protein
MMSQMHKLWMNTCLIALACLALFATGCGDDTTESTTTTADTTSGADVSDTSGTSGTDAVTTDDADGSTSGNTTTDTSSSGTDTSGTPPVVVTYPADPTGYVDGADTASTLSYVKSLVVPPVSDDSVATCCAKFSGSLYPEDEFDNQLSFLAPVVEGALKQNINDLIGEQIASGTVTILWDHIMLDGADDANGFVLAGLLGKFADGTTFDGAAGSKNASTGAGEFLVDPASFKTGTGEPLITFNPVTIASGKVKAGPGPFRLDLPILGFNLSLEVSETQITGDATITADGVSYTNGTLSGYVKASDIFGALNQVAGTCDCLGLNGSDLIELVNDKWQCSVANTAFDGCKGDPVSLCDSLSGAGQVCGLLGAISGFLDIDTDNDGKGDALSLGLRWEGVNASITGLVQ